VSELELFVACVPGLESLLAKEARSTLARPVQVVPGGVTLRGDESVWVRAHVWLGLASHVVVRLDRFEARHFNQVERGSAKVPWRAWLGEHVPWRVEAVSRRSKLYHTKAIAQRLEKIVAQAVGRPPVDGVDDSVQPVVIKARLVRDRCTLSLDGVGTPLHRRGWRQQTAKAPLREDLARALVISSGWASPMPLFDPMMGSGTIVIEAATMARGLAPGRLRSFAAAATPRWRAEVEAKAKAERRSVEPACMLSGRDRVPAALEAARGNAERAGVLEDLDLGLADVREAGPPDFGGQTGAVVCNPPYGHRVGGPARQLAPVFKGLGDTVRALGTGWHVAVVVPSRALLRASGLPLEPAWLTTHGGIKIEAMTTARKTGSS